MQENKRILILSTHPDDDILSFGGLIIKERAKGNTIFVSYLTCGGPCSNVSSEIREKEIREVSKFLDFFYEFFGHENDGLLSTIPNTELTRYIDNLIKKYEPHEVYCSALSEHADHIATYNAFLGACRLKSGWMPKLMAVGTYPFSDQLYTAPSGGKIFNPLSEEVYQKKLEAFKLYKSQFKPLPSPLGEVGLRNQAHNAGCNCGHEYAELYYQLRYIRD